MNFTTLMGFIAGVLQFVVAGYALRLNRIFGTMRVGWSLFWAFALLALLHLLQSVMAGGVGVEIGLKIDVMNALISLLLLIGMVHLEALLKERVRVEREEQLMRVELESEVRKKTAYLTRALEELQAEMNERKRVESEAQTVRWELDAVSRRAEMAQIAGSVLQSIGETLKSVNISTDLVANQVKESKFGIQPASRDPALEQTTLYIHLESIKNSLEKIAAMQHDYAKLAGDGKLEKAAAA